ncbi:MAG: histidine kinase [Aggregatilineales bacterium]
MALFVTMIVIAGLLLLAGNVWFVWRVLRPLNRLAAQAQTLASGNFEAFDESCGGIRDIEALRRAMSGMVSHVRRAQQQSRAYADSLAIGQETERARVARELHDDTVQSLIAIAQSIDLTRAWISTQPEQAITLLDASRKQTIDAVDGLRNLIADLRPPALDELGLIPALYLLAEKTQSVDVQVAVNGRVNRMDEGYELALFRVAQEAIHNAERHGAAKQVKISVDCIDSGVKLTVQDDGRGFTVPDDLTELATEKHFGLLGIYERITHLDGQFSIKSGATGTTIDVFLPKNGATQPAQTVRDPVCSALIEPHAAYGHTEFQGETYYFCCPVCQGAFQKNPDLYLEPANENT